MTLAPGLVDTRVNTPIVEDDTLKSRQGLSEKDPPLGTEENRPTELPSGPRPEDLYVTGYKLALIFTGMLLS